MNRQEFIEYIKNIYSTEPEYPWESAPGYAVFRHVSNNKWFAVVMDVPKEKFGIPSDEMLDVVNLKCDPILIGNLRKEKGIYPAYHMNKTYWISVALDGTVDDDKLKWLLDLSFDLTDRKKKMHLI